MIQLYFLNFLINRAMYIRFLTKKGVIKACSANEIVFATRTSFLINPDGIIKKIYEKVDPKTHTQKILKNVS